MMAQLYSQDVIPWDEIRSRKAIGDLLETPQLGGIWLIRADDAVVGYMVLTVCFSLEFHGRFGLLDEFFVEAPYRSQGIGTQGLRFAEEECRRRGFKALRLETGHENVRAQELYRRNGFEIHDRYLMTRWIP